MSTDLAGLGALVLVSLEWVALGWLSGVRFPQPGRAAAIASCALWVLVGALLVAAGQLVLALVGVAFSSVWIVLGSAALAAVGIRLACRTPRTVDLTAKQLPVGRCEAIGWTVLAVLLMATLVRSLVVPEAGWDAFSHWGLRAEAFANAGTLVDAKSEHEYYPPLVSLLEAWLYLHRGLVSIDLAKTIWAVLGSAFAVCLAWHLRLALRAAWLAPYLAGGIVLATPALLEGFWTGQADLALTAYLTLATLGVWQWQREPNRVWLVQVGIFSAAAVLTKFEGLPRVGIVAVAVAAEALLVRGCRRWTPLATLVVPAMAAAGVWTAFELTHAITPNGEHVGAFQPTALGGVLLGLVAVFGGVRTGGGLVVAALAWAVSARSLLGPPLRLLVLVVLGEAVGTLFAFLVSATAPEIEVATSATRLVQQFMPLALFAGAVGLVRLGHL